MKVGVIGSRNLVVENLEKYLPEDITEIVSGAARGIELKEFLPEYERYGRIAPLKRNLQIIEYADCVIAFWDGKSKGTKYVIDKCKKQNKNIRIFVNKQ